MTMIFLNGIQKKDPGGTVKTKNMAPKVRNTLNGINSCLDTDEEKINKLKNTKQKLATI